MKPVLIWGLLTGLFLLQGLYYVYLISLSSEGSSGLDLDKLLGFATLGFPLAALCGSILALKLKARLSVSAANGIALVMSGLGVLFLLVGIYAVYALRPETGDSMSPVSASIGFIVFPTVVIMLIWKYLKRGNVPTNNTVQVTPFFLCLSAHILQFILTAMWPFAEVFRFGGASLALLYSAVNTYKLQKSVE